MEISLKKIIPTTSDYYTLGGDTTISLAGAYSAIPHFKKTLLKINVPITKDAQDLSPTDKFENSIVDLKTGTDEITVRGWLEDDEQGGTATAGGSTTLTDSTETWIVNNYVGGTIEILSGTGSGQSKTISSNTATEITVNSAWTTNPDSTSIYLITKTAWEKMWQLRAMISKGGPLTEFVLGDITFKTATQEAFLEELTGNINVDDTGDIQTSAGKDVARIDISFNIYIGDVR